MRAITWLVLSVLVVAGCTQVDENPKWNPRADMPSWTYDAPLYYRPSEDLPVSETIGDGVPVYYSREAGFFIRHPGGYQLNGVPRMGVWYSNSAGREWLKAGFFGVEQTHFLFKAQEDGQYWIRFVGPGQGTEDCPPGTPNRVYIVDRKPPTITLAVSPSPWEDEDKKVPRFYKVGENVTLYWSVSDTNLAKGTIRMGTCFGTFPHNLAWTKIPYALAQSDSITIEVPPEAVKYGGLYFRVEATDKAGNIGLATSDLLRIAGAAVASQPARKLLAAPGMERIDTEPQKPGWPVHGDKLKGGAERELNWMPKTAANYDVIELQFTSNNGRTWQTTASNIKAGTAVHWTIPRADSDECRLRVAAISKTRQTTERIEIPLAVSQRFAVASGGVASKPAE